MPRASSIPEMRSPGSSIAYVSTGHCLARAHVGHSIRQYRTLPSTSVGRWEKAYVSAGHRVGRA
eukprot:1673145-Rhodomonas_salina.3